MNQPQPVDQSKNSSQVNSNNTKGNFDNILYNGSLLFLGQFVISVILGKMIYCGQEGTCNAPWGFTLLFLAIWIFFDLLILLLYAFKYKLARKQKIIIIVSILLSIILICLNYFINKKF